MAITPIVNGRLKGIRVLLSIFVFIGCGYFNSTINHPPLIPMAPAITHVKEKKKHRPRIPGGFEPTFI